MKPTLVNSFACLDCKQIFKLRIELKKHTQRKHNENFPLSKYSLNAPTSHLFIKSHNSKAVTGATGKSHISPEKPTTQSVKAHRTKRGRSDAVKQHRLQKKLPSDCKKLSSSDHEKTLIVIHEKFTPLKEFSQLRHGRCGCTRCPSRFLSYADFVSHFLMEHVGKSTGQNGSRNNGLRPSEDAVRFGIGEQDGRNTATDRKDASKAVTGQFDIRRDVTAARPFLHEPSNGHVQSTTHKSNSAFSPKKSEKTRKASEKRKLQLYCKHLTRRPFILHKCADCNKSFTFYKHLREHERGHAPRYHHYCCYCSNILMSSLSYYRHIKTAHNEELQNHDKSFKEKEIVGTGTKDFKSTRMLAKGLLGNWQAQRSRIICGDEGITLESAAGIHCGSDAQAENTVIDLSLSSIIWKYYATCSRSQGMAVEKEPKVTHEMACQAYKRESGRFPNDARSTIILGMETTKMKVRCEDPTSHIKSNDESVSKHRKLLNGNAKSPPNALVGTSDKNTWNRKSLPEDSKFINLQDESELNKTWLCSQCSLHFDDYSALMEHVKTHEGHIQRCSYCARKFTQTAGLLSHIKAKHLNSPGYYNKSRIEDDSKFNDVKTLDVMRGQCTNVDQSQTGLPSDTIIHCLLCDLKMRGLETAKNHIQLVHNESILRRLLQSTW